MQISNLLYSLKFLKIFIAYCLSFVWCSIVCVGQTSQKEETWFGGYVCMGGEELGGEGKEAEER